MAEPIFTVGPAPHIRVGTSTVKNHYYSAIALIPIVVAAIIGHGFNAFGILFLSVTTAVVTEGISQKVMKQPMYALDGHSILMGLIFGLLMPAAVPWWVVIIGVSMGTFVAKQVFGGLGCYPFNPALIGYLMVLVSWPLKVAPIANDSLAQTCPYAIALGGLIIFAIGSVNRTLPISFIVGLLVSAGIFNYVYPETVPGAIDQLMTGTTILAAFFIVTDPTSSPANKLPKILFGLTAGVMLVVIRVYGSWMEAVPFAILLANMISPLLDRIHSKPTAMENTNA